MNGSGAHETATAEAPARGKPPVARARRSRRTTRPATQQDDIFAAYMREVSRHDLLTPAQEKALAFQLFDLRINYWRQALSYAPFVRAALDLLQSESDLDAELVESFDALRRASDGARRSNRKVAQDAFEASLADTARRLALADAECIGADRIAADLDLLEAGARRGTSMDVRMPREGSRPFADYVGRVRRASAALRAKRNEFARANLRLVIRIANRFHRTGLSLQDRVQEGNIGLMKAVERFDPNRGFRFSTYASWWIRHAIRRAVVNRGRTIRLPAHLQALWAKISRSRNELRGQLGREPTVQQVAEAVDQSVDKVELVLEAMSLRPVSLDARMSGEDDRGIGDLLPAEEERTPSEQLDLDAATRRLRGTLLTLEPMERDILRQRFGLDGTEVRTLAEIGTQYSLSRERIRQLQQKALERVKSRLDIPTL